MLPLIGRLLVARTLRVLCNTRPIASRHGPRPLTTGKINRGLCSPPPDPRRMPYPLLTSPDVPNLGHLAASRPHARGATVNKCYVVTLIGLAPARAGSHRCMMTGRGLCLWAD